MRGGSCEVATAGLLLPQARAV